MHGLHDLLIRATKNFNLGHNVLKARRLLKALYWVGTHAGVRKRAGFGPDDFSNTQSCRCRPILSFEQLNANAGRGSYTHVGTLVDTLNVSNLPPEIASPDSGGKPQ